MCPPFNRPLSDIHGDGDGLHGPDARRLEEETEILFSSRWEQKWREIHDEDDDPARTNLANKVTVSTSTSATAPAPATTDPNTCSFTVPSSGPEPGTGHRQKIVEKEGEERQEENEEEEEEATTSTGYEDEDEDEDEDTDSWRFGYHNLIRAPSESGSSVTLGRDQDFDSEVEEEGPTQEQPLPETKEEGDNDVDL